MFAGTRHQAPSSHQQIRNYLRVWIVMGHGSNGYRPAGMPDRMQRLLNFLLLVG
jgi:hypothetical protein